MANRKNDLKICIVVVSVFSLLYSCYCGYIMTELPYLAWFDQIPLADLWLSHTIKISDLLSPYCEHGMLGTNILYLVNVTLFHGKTLFDVVINDVNVSICGFIIIIITTRTLAHNAIFKIIVAIAQCIFLFGGMQGSSGAMETQVRLGLLFLLFLMVQIDKLFHRDDVSWKKLIAVCLLIIISINVFGTLYSFAGIPLIWFITVLQIIRKQKAIHHITISVACFATIPIYIIQYGILTTKGISQIDIKSLLNLPNFFKGLCAWNANAVLGWAYYVSNYFSPAIYLIVGAIVLAITLICIWMFFAKKMYEKTWLPLMCIVYSFGVYVLVFLGRNLGWGWYANEWYNVHLKLSCASCIWILAYFIKREKLSKSLFFYGCILFMVSAGICGNVFTLIRAPHVKAYYAEKQKYLFIQNAENMPVDADGATPLLHSLDMTMESINILKKWNLSVYQYWDSYVSCPYNFVEEKVKYTEGKYEDGWANDTVILNVNSAVISNITINYFSPSDQTLTVSFDDGSPDVSLDIKKGEGSFNIPCFSKDILTITIRSNYLAQLESPDLRQASYCIIDTIYESR